MGLLSWQDRGMRATRGIGLVALATTVAVLTAGVASAVTITRAIVLDRSIAGVALGQRRAAIERRIGSGYVVSARADTSTRPAGRVERIAYDAAGLYVTYVSSGASPRQLRAGKAEVLETTWTSFRTPQGVHVGSPLAAVRKIPGIRCFGAVCQHGYRHGRGGTSFLVDPIRKQVVRIVVGFAA
jgi:hypothetical protein